MLLLAVGGPGELERVSLQTHEFGPLRSEAGLTDPWFGAEGACPEGIDPDWWGTVQNDIGQSEYHIQWQEQVGAYQSPNRGQNLRFTYRGDGFSAEPRTYDGEGPPWKLGMRLSAWGREGARSVFWPGELHLDGNRAAGEGLGVTVTYCNGRDGMRQDFLIRERPRGSRPLRLWLGLELDGVIMEVPSDVGEVTFTRSVPGGARVMTYGDLEVRDAEGRLLQAQMVKEGEAQLAVVVDDAEAVYPILVDPLSSAPTWTAEGNQGEAGFGYSVATAGDVNGDGYSDVIVGAHQYDNGETDEGRAHLYHGSAAGLSASPDWAAESNQAGANFGMSVATAGDVNGDGYSDVIVGAHQYDNGETDEGRAYVYHGSSTSLGASPAWTAEGDQIDAWFGSSVATAGDVNGDGYSDVIIGAPSYSNGQTYEGRAYLYHGAAAGLAASPAWTAEGDQAYAYFGGSVAVAGDVSSDGYSDVIVGARQYTNGEPAEGRAFVYQGSPAGLAASPDWTAESDQAWASFGISVATAGDVNGDGHSDVIVGAAGYTNGEIEEGGAYLYQGSSAGLAAVSGWAAESDQAHAQLGESVATAGDVNGDGYSDVIVGAYRYDNGQTDEGRAFAYFGSSGGLAASPDWTAESDQAYAHFAYSVATAGDANGDGYSDVIVGAPSYADGQTDEGRGFVYYGSSTGLSASPDWTAQSNHAWAKFGISVAAAGDVNGDGYSDVIVGAYGYSGGQTGEGRAYVYHGGANGIAASPAWTAESNQAGAQLGNSVAAAGDVNGDGYGDVIVGAYAYDSGDTDEGRAFVYHGSPAGLDTLSAWTRDGNQPEAYFANSVATAGDVNGDGYSDVIVGAPGYTNGQTLEGGAFAYHGGSTGLAASPGWTAEGNQASVTFGRSVATAGDVNGDGYSDVIVSAPGYSNGRVCVYHGSSTGLDALPAWTAEGNQSSDAFGSSLAAGGDVNGDGYGDVIVGAPGYANGEQNEGQASVYYGNDGDGLHVLPRQWRSDVVTPVVPPLKTRSGSQAGLGLLARTFFGRADLRVQFEVKPMGTPFDGTGLVTTGWLDPGTTGASTSQVIGGLSDRTMYRWRARVKYCLSDGAPQPYGRWIYQPYNGGLGEADFQVSDDDMPPNTPVLNITRLNAIQCRLWWYTVAGATSYNLYRGTSAFFAPATPWQAVTAPDTFRVFGAGVGNPNVNYYFLCRSVGAWGESLNSERVGEFDVGTATAVAGNDKSPREVEQEQ
jgi:hypothetical protein